MRREYSFSLLSKQKKQREREKEREFIENNVFNADGKLNRSAIFFLCLAMFLRSSMLLSVDAVHPL